MIMNKKIWNLDTTKIRPTGWWISLKPSSGTISFSRDIVTQLELEGKAVNFIQNEDRPNDWYLAISDDPAAIPVKRNRKPGTAASVHYLIQNIMLTRAILKSCKLAMATTRILVGPSTPDGYAILTKSAKPYTSRSKEHETNDE